MNRPSEPGAISVKLQQGTHEKLAHMAADRGVTLRALLNELIEREYQQAPPKTTKKPKRAHSPRVTRWTADSVVEALKKREKAGKAITAWKVQLEDAGLYEGGCRVYGPWTAALKAAGIEVPERSCGLPAKGLKRVRQKKGLSQAELAKRAGTSQSHISELESLRINPTKTMLVALAHALDANEAKILSNRANYQDGLAFKGGGDSTIGPYP
jgi:DNA-binding XRE family transcriptional regulator